MRATGGEENTAQKTNSHRVNKEGMFQWPGAPSMLEKETSGNVLPTLLLLQPA